jgi:hypothetical protein
VEGFLFDLLTIGKYAGLVGCLRTTHGNESLQLLQVYFMGLVGNDRAVLDGLDKTISTLLHSSMSLAVICSHGFLANISSQLRICSLNCSQFVGSWADSGNFHCLTIVFS